MRRFPPFGGLLRPLLRAGLSLFRCGLAQIKESASTCPSYGDAVENQLVGDLVGRLTRICGPALVMELNIARVRGELAGDGPEARFDFFPERYLSLPRAFEILEGHPAMARMLSTSIYGWVDALVEFFTRLTDDRPEFHGLLKVNDDQGDTSPFDVLESVTLSMSDLHNHGRSVIVATAQTGHRIVYKPRSLAVDATMGRFLEQVGQLGLRYELRSPRVFERAQYGWMEYVERGEVTTVDALSRFYWRQGAWICILHLLRGVDVHHENTIAVGEHPVLVDNEALFHPSYNHTRLIR